jgi:5'-3' exonuclease
MAIPLQLKMTKLIVSLLGITTLCHPDEECDDMIASYAHQCGKTHDGIIIFGSDHDFYQLLGDRTQIMIPHTQGEEIFTQENFLEKNSFYPDEYWRVQTLGGCATDKVPGMIGIGEATACELIRMNAWDKIKANDVNLKFPNKRAETVFRKNYATWEPERDEKLVRLQKDLSVAIDWNWFDQEKFRKWLIRLEFKHWLLPKHFQRVCQVFGG